MKSHLRRRLIAITVLGSFALQCVVAVQAEPSQICLHQLGLINVSQQKLEQGFRSCCVHKHQEDQQVLSASCCRQHPPGVNPAEECDGCDCCVSHQSVPQTSFAPTVTLPELQLNTLCVVSLETVSSEGNLASCDEVRPRDPPTQSALCVWLK